MSRAAAVRRCSSSDTLTTASESDAGEVEQELALSGKASGRRAAKRTTRASRGEEERHVEQGAHACLGKTAAQAAPRVEREVGRVARRAQEEGVGEGLRRVGRSEGSVVVGEGRRGGARAHRHRVGRLHEGGREPVEREELARLVVGNVEHVGDGVGVDERAGRLLEDRDDLVAARLEEVAHGVLERDEQLHAHGRHEHERERLEPLEVAGEEEEGASPRSGREA
jgi:hypothetical protein